MDLREQRVVQATEDLAEDLLDFACRLVAEPSTVGNEQGAARVLTAEFERLSLRPVAVPMDGPGLTSHPGYAPVPWAAQGRTNVVCTRAADGQGGRSALFNGHLDVVSPEPLDLWDHDPFSPQIREGWLHGRGAGDMKAGVAAMTYAVHAVEKAGFGLQAPVTLEGVIEEECSGNGALACLAAGHDAEAVLIPEPFGPTILTSQVGVLWFKVVVRGRPSHVLSATSGANAIEKCGPLIAALRELEEELNREDVPGAYRGVGHPLHLNIGIFRGGDWPSTVPAEAEFHGRLSFFPGVPYERVRQRVTRAVAAAAERDPWLAENPPQVTFYGFRSEGHSVARDLPAFMVLNDSHRALAGADAAEYVACCTTDLRAFHSFGRGQATCYGPVAENIHAANERVRIDSVVHVAKVYALFLARWCGLIE